MSKVMGREADLMVRERLFREVTFKPSVIDPNVNKMHATQRLGRRVFLAEAMAQCKALKWNQVGMFQKQNPPNHPQRWATVVQKGEN